MILRKITDFILKHLLHEQIKIKPFDLKIYQEPEDYNYVSGLMSEALPMLSMVHYKFQNSSVEPPNPRIPNGVLIKPSLVRDNYFTFWQKAIKKPFPRCYGLRIFLDRYIYKTYHRTLNKL